MAEELLLFVGTLNREAPYFQGARGNGLNVYSFDEDRLSATLLAQYGGIDNPTYLSVTPDGLRIYANSEVFGWAEGLVTAFSFDRAKKELSHLNMQPTLGSITAHNTVSRDGKRLLVVNYAVGEGGPDQSLAIMDIRADGSLSPAVASVAHSGKGPNAARQERAHAHSVTEVADNLVVVADLGLDQLVAYRISADGRPVRLAASSTAPGAGPRHLAVHPNGRFVFAMNELDSTVSVHALDQATGVLSLIEALPAVPAGARQGNHCSDIQISPDGRFLYGANRGHDSIAIFAVDAESGHLTALGYTPCGGATPRNLVLTPSGRHLLAANQNADRVTILRRDAATGLLQDTGAHIAIGTPMCLKFAKGGP